MGPTVSMKALRGVVLASAVRSGATPATLAALIGVAPGLLGDVDARVQHSVVERAWETLAAHCSEAHLGLFAASLLGAAPIDLVDIALCRAPDFRSLVDGFLRFQRLFHDANESFRRSEGELEVLTLRLAPTAPRIRHLTEFVLATWTLKARRALGPRCRLAEIRLIDPPPAKLDAFVRAFGDVPVRFGAGEDGVAFPRTLLDEPLVEADPATWSVLGKQLEKALAQRAPRTSFVDGARQAMQLELVQGRADAEALARALAVSTRSLQRKLAEHDTSYSELLDEVRRDLATVQLEHSATSVTEIAFLLGFSDLSAFSRAFRRWTGTSPVEYRRQHAS